MIDAQIAARRRLHRLALEASRFGRDPRGWIRAVSDVYPDDVAVVGARGVACICAVAWRRLA